MNKEINESKEERNRDKKERKKNEQQQKLYSQIAYCNCANTFSRSEIISLSCFRTVRIGPIRISVTHTEHIEL